MSCRLFQRTPRLLAIPAVLSLAVFTGCAAVSSSTISPTNPTTLSQNWQIQTGSAIGSSQGSAIFLAGAMQIQGSQVTAIFKTMGACLGLPQPARYTGTYNAASGSLSFNLNPYVTAQLDVPSNPTSLSTGTLAGGGYLCNAVLGPTASVGEEIPTLTGIFTGNATSSPSGNTGTATLTLTQSTTANTDGTFPLTASLQFTGGTCNSTTALTGTINGATYTLSSATGVTLTGLDNTGGASLPAATIDFANGPCDTGSSSAATYTGTLAQK